MHAYGQDGRHDGRQALGHCRDGQCDTKSQDIPRRGSSDILDDEDRRNHDGRDDHDDGAEPAADAV